MAIADQQQDDTEFERVSGMEWSESAKSDWEHEGIVRRIWLAVFPEYKIGLEKWKRSWDFRLVMIGSCVGFGNVWRFPHLVAKYGGGSFVFVYILAVLFLAYPMYLMELYLGQFSGRKPVDIFRSISPAFAGIGWACLTTLSTSGIYYNAVLSWALFYMFVSMGNPLPWSQCGKDWNTNFCFSLRTYQRCVNERPTERWYVKGRCYNETVPIAEFFRGLDSCVRNLKIEDRCRIHLLFKFNSVDEMHRRLGSYSFDNWFREENVLKFYQGCQQDNFEFVPFNYSLPKGFPGNRFYMKTELCSLKDVELWFSALGQGFFSLDLGMGAVTTLASFNMYRTDLLRDSLTVVISDTVFSIVVGFGIFGLIGYLASQLNLSVMELLQLREPGPGLAFISGIIRILLADAMAIVPYPYNNILSFLFYFFLVLLAADTGLINVGCFLMTIFDEFPILVPRQKRIVAIGVVCVVAFLLGLPTVTRYGTKIETLVSDSGIVLMLLTAVAELLVISYIYGLKNVMKDMYLMLGREVNTAHTEGSYRFQLGRWLWKSRLAKIYLYISWWGTVPIGVLGLSILVFVLVIRKVDPEGRRDIGAEVVFWLSSLAVFPVCLYIGLSLSLLRKIPVKDLFKPTINWNPRARKYIKGRYGINRKQKQERNNHL